MSEERVWCLGVEWFSCLQPTDPSSVFCAHTGPHEGITSPTIFIIITLTLGMAVITVALFVNYQPCERNRRKRASRQREQNKDKEDPFTDI